jgi:hypothetical protein
VKDNKRKFLGRTEMVIKHEKLFNLTYISHKKLDENIPKH